MTNDGHCGWCGKDIVQECIDRNLDLITTGADFCLVQERVLAWLRSPDRLDAHLQSVAYQHVHHLSHTGDCADKLAASFRVKRALLNQPIRWGELPND